ncbi:cell division protein FtsL [Brevibacillus sp. TJ4]|uniref:cell division protein FtsL n=1 Tax=Brevibacillus sp. TJ4 TaxID=3234853 RepID=UPI0037D8EA89
MSYYYRGNLAVDIEREESSRSVTKVKRKIRFRQSIPTGEKLLYLLFISLTVAGLGFVGVRYSQISQYHYEIQSAKKENERLAEQNAALQLQIEQMSNRDRIQKEAERQGMVFNPAAVHVIGKTDKMAPATQTTEDSQQTTQP